MAKEKSKWRKVGTILQSKAGNPYIKFDEAVGAGEVAMLQKPSEKYQRMLERGIISEEEAEKKTAAIPAYVKYEVVVGPPKA